MTIRDLTSPVSAPTPAASAVQLPQNVAAVAEPVPVVSNEAISRAKLASRTQSIDVIRLIAAAGIVLVHAAKSEPLISIGHFFRFAVPFYLFASLYFQAQSLRRNPNRTYAQYVLSRFRRLYLPFLAWSAIYFIARDLRQKVLLPIGFEPGVLWKGVEYHLWFLPYLLMWSVILATCYWGLLRWDRRWRWPIIFLALAAGALVAMSSMPVSWDEQFPSNTYAYVQWWRSLPATCLALAFALFMTMGPVLHSIPTWLGIAGIGLTIYCSVQQVFHGIQLIPRALSGLGCMLAALMPWSKGPVVAKLAHWGRYSYGIYLCHVLVVEPIRVVESKCHLVASTPVDFMTFVLGFAGSLALVCTLARSRWTAWLNG